MSRRSKNSAGSFLSAFAIFESGDLRASQDGGQTWAKVLSDPAAARLFHVSGPAPRYYLCRSDGKILWSPSLSGNWSPINGIAGDSWRLICYNGCQCQALLASTGLYTSCDGGATWTFFRSAEGQNLRSLIALKDRTFLIGGEGTIRRPAQVIETRRLGDVNFEFGKAELTEAAKTELAGILARIKARPGLRVRIEGYTDNKGDDAYNLDLSRRRAQSVMNFLVNGGIAPGQFEIQGYGREYPAAANDTEEGRAKNRRVTIYLLE